MPRLCSTKKMHKLTDKGVGKLIVKEYPTGAASAIHFRALLKELQIKRDFKPDLICIDYLNICSSARMKSMVVLTLLSRLLRKS